MSRRLILVLSLCCLAACGSSATCGEDEVSLRITAPEEGTTIRTERVMIDVEACGLELGENIRIQLIEPVVADYGFIPYEGRPLLGIEVPTLPGTMTFEASNMEGDLTSQRLSFNVERDD